MKKMKGLKLLTVFAFALMLALSVFMLTACPNPDTTFYVTFDTTVATVTESDLELREGDSFVLPNTERNGYVLLGWQINAVGRARTGGTRLYWGDHNTQAGDTLNLRAVWRAAERTMAVPQGLVANVAIVNWSAVPNAFNYELRVGLGASQFTHIVNRTSYDLRDIPAFNALATDVNHPVAVRALGGVRDGVIYNSSAFSSNVNVMRRSNQVDEVIAMIRGLENLELNISHGRAPHGFVYVARAGLDALDANQRAQVGADVVAILTAAEAEMEVLIEEFIAATIASLIDLGGEYPSFTLANLDAHILRVNNIAAFREVFFGFGINIEETIPAEALAILVRAEARIATLQGDRRVETLNNLIENVLPVYGTERHADVDNIVYAQNMFTNVLIDSLERARITSANQTRLQQLNQRIARVVLPSPSIGVQSFEMTISDSSGDFILSSVGQPTQGHPVLIGTELVPQLVAVQPYFIVELLVSPLNTVVGASHTVESGVTIFSFNPIPQRLITINEFPRHGIQRNSLVLSVGSQNLDVSDINNIPRVSQGETLTISWIVEEYYSSELRINGELITSVPSTSGLQTHSFVVSGDFTINLSTSTNHIRVYVGEVDPAINFTAYFSIGIVPEAQRIDLRDVGHVMILPEEFADVRIYVEWSWTNVEGYYASIRLNNDTVFVGDDNGFGGRYAIITVPEEVEDAFDLELSARMVKVMDGGRFDFLEFQHWAALFGAGNPEAFVTSQIDHLWAILDAFGFYESEQDFYIDVKLNSEFRVSGQEIIWYVDNTEGFVAGRPQELIEFGRSAFELIPIAGSNPAIYEVVISDRMMLLSVILELFGDARLTYTPSTGILMFYPQYSTFFVAFDYAYRVMFERYTVAEVRQGGFGHYQNLITEEMPVGVGNSLLEFIAHFALEEYNDNPAIRALIAPFLATNNNDRFMAAIAFAETRLELYSSMFFVVEDDIIHLHFNRTRVASFQIDELINVQGRRYDINLIGINGATLPEGMSLLWHHTYRSMSIEVVGIAGLPYIIRFAPREGFVPIVETRQAETPTVTVSGNVASWEAVAGGYGFRVYINGNYVRTLDNETRTITVDFMFPGTNPQIQVVAIGAGELPENGEAVIHTDSQKSIAQTLTIADITSGYSKIFIEDVPLGVANLVVSSYDNGIQGAIVNDDVVETGSDIHIAFTVLMNFRATLIVNGNPTVFNSGANTLVLEVTSHTRIEFTAERLFAVQIGETASSIVLTVQYALNYVDGNSRANLTDAITVTESELLTMTLFFRWTWTGAATHMSSILINGEYTVVGTLNSGAFYGRFDVETGSNINIEGVVSARMLDGGFNFGVFALWGPRFTQYFEGTHTGWIVPPTLDSTQFVINRFLSDVMGETLSRGETDPYVSKYFVSSFGFNGQTITWFIDGRPHRTTTFTLRPLADVTGIYDIILPRSFLSCHLSGQELGVLRFHSATNELRLFPSLAGVNPQYMIVFGRAPAQRRLQFQNSFWVWLGQNQGASGTTSEIASLFLVNPPYNMSLEEAYEYLNQFREFNIYHEFGRLGTRDAGGNVLWFAYFRNQNGFLTSGIWNHLRNEGFNVLGAEMDSNGMLWLLTSHGWLEALFN
ncbi:MAG: hypothetical protein FWC11_00865 [Firmicutes bacterium]|nr:hypothetical protein [Bacillota bacterium]MCL2255393.1 hypothetical protein [Bacillota bacterium]